MTIIVLVFTTLLLTLIAVAVRERFLRSKSEETPKLLLQNHFDESPITLFPIDRKGLAEIDRARHQQTLDEKRARLLSWASLADIARLREIPFIEDKNLRADVCSILIERAKSRAEVLNLTALVLSSETVASDSKLIDAYRQIWESSPDRQTTTNIFHLAARADDADLLFNVFAQSLKMIETGRLALSKDELFDLSESHYWLLSPRTRNSGVAFWLREKLGQGRWKNS